LMSNSLFGMGVLKQHESSDAVISSSQLDISFKTPEESKDEPATGYTSIVADKGLTLFRQCTHGSPVISAASLRRQSLQHTPSMIMINEVMEVLNSNCTLTPMDNESTGGVYQLRRQKSVYGQPVVEEITSSLKPHLVRSRNSDSFPKSPSACSLSSDKLMQVVLARSKSVAETYVVHHEPTNRQRSNSRVAVFKPQDEETGSKLTHALGQINPERAGLVVGGGAKRERAAYLLDTNIGRFSGVPETALVSGKLAISNVVAGGKLAISNRKTQKRGSLQRFCESDGSAEDRPDLVRLASNLQVQKIGILDMRIFNTDRHGGNILCKQDSNGTTLIPIDHGMSIPDWHFLAEAFFDWAYWAQVEGPFDPAAVNAIERINIEKDSVALRGIGIPEGCVATMILSTMTLKQGSVHGLTLKELAKVFQRPFSPGHNLHNKYFSPLEHMLVIATRNIGIQEYTPAGTSDSTVLLGALTEPASFDEMERMAFGDLPPPDELYPAFLRVLETYMTSKEWMRWVQI